MDPIKAFRSAIKSNNGSALYELVDSHPDALTEPVFLDYSSKPQNLLGYVLAGFGEHKQELLLIILRAYLRHHGPMAIIRVLLGTLGVLLTTSSSDTMMVVVDLCRSCMPSDGNPILQVMQGRLRSALTDKDHLLSFCCGLKYNSSEALERLRILIATIVEHGSPSALWDALSSDKICRILMDESKYAEARVLHWLGAPFNMGNSTLWRYADQNVIETMQALDPEARCDHPITMEKCRQIRYEVYFQPQLLARLLYFI